MDFPRIKIGVGEKPKGYDLTDYVLGHFSKGEIEIYDDVFPDVDDAVKLMVMDDISGAMNQYNKKARK